MKKVFSLVLTAVLLLLCPPLQVRAEETLNIQFDTLLPEDPDYTGVTAMTDKIVEFMGSVAGMEGGANAKAEDIDYSKALKVYIDTDIFKSGAEDQEVLLSQLQGGDYVWVLPLSMGGKNYMVNIAYRKVAEPNLPAGWEVSGVQQTDEKFNTDYRAVVRQKLALLQTEPENCRVAFAGGLPQIHYPAAVIFSQQKAAYLIPLYYLPIEGTEQQKNSLTARGVAAKNVLYQYKAIAQTVNNMPPPNSSLSGGDIGIRFDEPKKSAGTGAEPWYFAAGGGILLLAAALIFWQVKSRQKKRVAGAK